MKKIAQLAFLSVKNKINPLKKKFGFEIIGFDFMIDSQFKVWLI